MASDDEWITVCEDDAIPVPHFNIQAQAALDNTPRNVNVVSFYMGRMRPQAWQPRMKNAVAQADRRNINWITSNTTLHAVCLAIRGPRPVNHMLDTTATLVRPIDERITMWCRRFGHTTAYSHPSLVEHADETPCITNTIRRCRPETRQRSHGMSVNAKSGQPSPSLSAARLTNHEPMPKLQKGIRGRRENPYRRSTFSESASRPRRHRAALPCGRHPPERHPRMDARRTPTTTSNQPTAWKT